MPITLRRILENTNLGVGYRIVLEYTFSDGTVITIKCRGNKESDAESFLVSKESQVSSNKINNDIDNLISNNSDVPTEDVTQKELDKEWLKRGYNSNDPIYAYAHLSKVAQKILDLNLTNEELSVLFNEPIDTIEKTLAKWIYLDANKETILAYETLKGNM